jgi:S-DNA-T family DNA segregation ATPase FtsK/SpoIIIE
MSASRTSKSRSAASATGISLATRLALLMSIAAWAFVAASLVGFDPADPPGHVVFPANDPVANWCGPFGAAVAYGLVRTLGVGSWVLLAFIGLALFSSAAGQPPRHVLVRSLGVIILTASVSCVQAIVFPLSSALPDLAGGVVGSVSALELSARVGHFAIVVALMGILVGALVAADEWVLAIFGWTMRQTREHGMPAAKVAAAATGEVALAAGSASAAVAARAGTSFFSGLRDRVLTWAAAAKKGQSKPTVRENDIDDQQPGKLSAKAPKQRRRVAAVPSSAQIEREITDPDGPASQAMIAAEATGAELDATADEESNEEPEVEIKPSRKGRKPAKLTRPVEVEAEVEADEAAVEEAGAAHDVEDTSGEDDDELPGAPQVYSEQALREKISRLPIVFGQANKQVATEADLDEMRGGATHPTPATPGAPQIDADGVKQAEGQAPRVYQFPGVDLLENPEENFNAKLEETVREQATALESALRQYRIDGEVVGIESGPVITLFDVRLAPGTKVAALQAVSSDIARALRAINIRIVPNQVGRDTVGVEVPNSTKEKVRLKELMGKGEKFAGMKLPLFLGKDASGEPLIEDLTKMPHMLIAGTTGSGKSVAMNTIIMGFLYTKKPSELKLVLVDPKMVEMSQFKDIPHLMCPVVTEMSKAAAILEWACVKMDERYELLAEAGCRDIATYNELPWEELKERMNPASPEEEARIPRKLPYMVFIIDELADLMMTAKEVESHIIRIAQKARAVGIHLILATQRPQANVVTGLIKSNMPCRVAFKVASGMDSRIVLDQKGGELLLGHGDMLFLSPRSSKLSRAQGTLVDDLEIRRVVRFMRDVAGPSFERQLLQIRKPAEGASAGPAGTGLGGLTDEDRLLQSKNNSSASLAAAQEDPLFARSVEIVLESRRGSVSLLQRRLAIGYTRASRLIDLMGIAGIISDHKGSVARDVLITEEDWAVMKRLASEEAKAKGVRSIDELKDSGGSSQSGLFESPGASAGAAPGSDRQPSGESPPFEVDDVPQVSDEDLYGEGGDTALDGADEDDEDEVPRGRGRR